MIEGVNSNQIANQNICSKKQERTKDKSCDNTKQPAAVLELGKTPEKTAGVYGKPAASAKSASKDNVEEKTNKANAEEIQKLWAEADRATQNLRDMVEQLLKSQGKTFNDVLYGKADLKVDDETRKAAQLAISEDGECGIQAVSDRIVSFAKAISSNNPEKYDELMGAIDKGFEQAKRALGGELPEICQKTYDEIHRKMDEWKTGEDKDSMDVKD